jgi:uncharacterized protein (TIGR04255 family)
MRRTLPPLYLPGSPLVAVLAQIRFSPIAAMEKYVPAIQDELRRKGFLRFREELIEEVGWVVRTADGNPVIDGRTQKQWEFTNAENTWSIRLASDSVTLATSEYVTYEHPFEENLAIALDAIHRNATMQLVARFGLRYVDLIQPEDGYDFPDYLDERLLGLPAGEMGMLESFPFTQMRGPTDAGFMTLRCAFLNSGDVLPPDLTGLTLRLNQSVETGVKVALLDLDHTRHEEQEYDRDQLLESLALLHDRLDIAFRKSVTPEALERWGASEPVRKDAVTA